MDDNVHMEPCGVHSCLIGNTNGTDLVNNGLVNVNGCSAGSKSWRPNHILDFSDLSIGWYLLLNSVPCVAITCIIVFVFG